MVVYIRIMLWTKLTRVICCWKTLRHWRKMKVKEDIVIRI